MKKETKKEYLERLKSLIIQEDKEFLLDIIEKIEDPIAKKEMGTDVISFENITFGQLFAFVKKEGLMLCSELRLQIKYGSKTKEVGSFCDAFGIKRIKSPSAYKKKVKKYSKKIRYKKPKENEPTKKRRFIKKKIVYYKCGKIGHKANKCRLKEKITEICQNEEDIKNN